MTAFVLYLALQFGMLNSSDTKNPNASGSVTEPPVSGMTQGGWEDIG